MKKSVKIIIAIMAVVIVGLGAGLAFALLQQPAKNKIDSIQVFAHDDSVIDMSDGDDKLYAVNLNARDTFALKYVASPVGLSQYYVIVSTSDSAITVKNGGAVQGGQTGVIEFNINRMPTDGEPVVITFKAVADKSGGEVIVSTKAKVLVTQPSTLKKVEGVKYNGEFVTWTAVAGNTDNVTIDSTKVKYSVHLQYAVGEEEKSINYTTPAGICSFRLDGVAGGFEKGTINKITVQALGDNTLTTDGEASAEYKFYILKTPTYSFSDMSINLSDVDSNAKGVVLIRNNGEEDYHYRLTKDIQYWSLNTIQMTDKEYSIAFKSTVVDNASLYTHRVNSVLEDGIEFFDSPITDVTNVRHLNPVEVGISSNGVGDVSLDNVVVNSYSDTAITWSHVSDDVLVRSKIKYLVRVSLGTRTKEYIVDYESDIEGVDFCFNITDDVLTDIGATSECDNISVSVSAFMPMSSDDNGEMNNDAVGGLLVLDSALTTSSTISIQKYTPSISDFAVNISGTNMSYVIPAYNSSKVYIEEVTFIFVSDDGDKYIHTSTSSSTLNMQSLITKSGEYDVYIFYKGSGNVINYNSPSLKIDNVYKTIGAPTGIALDASGMLSFNEVEGATSYVVTYHIGGSEYKDELVSADSINVIDRLDYWVGYNNVSHNNGSVPYSITIQSKSNAGGVYGGSVSIEFYKFESVSNIRLNEDNSKITWDEVDGAFAYKVQIGSEYVIVNNAENYLEYKNYPDLLNEIVSGDNDISVIVLGIDENSTILQSNASVTSIPKVSAVSNITIENDVLYFDGNNNARYLLEVSGAGAVKTFEVVNSINQTNKIDLLQLEDYNIANNVNYTARVKKTIQGSFDSDYSEAINFCKLPKIAVSVVNIDGELRVVWQKSDIVNGTHYITNATNSAGQEPSVLQDEYTYYYSLSDIQINDSGLGITKAGNYLFDIQTYSNAVYTTHSDIAYLSSDNTRITIARLDVPTISIINDTSLSISSAVGATAVQLVVDLDEDIDSITSGNTAVVDLSAITTSGTYSAVARSIGNLANVADYVKNTFVLDSVNKSINIIKLAPVVVSIANSDGVNQPIFVKTNKSVQDINYDVYCNDVKLPTNVMYDYNNAGTAGINYNAVGENNYYVKCTAQSSVDTYYLTSERSNEVCINNIEFATNLTFIDEDTIQISDHLINGTNIVRKHIITIADIDDSDELILDTTVDNTIYGLTYNEDSKVYILDLSVLKSSSYIEVGHEYRISVVSEGVVSGSLAYNNTASPKINMEYYSKDIVGINIDDTMNINLSNIPSGYDVMTLSINADEYVIANPLGLTGTASEYTANGKSIFVSLVQDKLIVDLADYSAGTYNYAISFSRSDYQGLVAEVKQGSMVKNYVFGQNGETISVSQGVATINGNADYDYVVYSDDKVVSINDYSWLNGTKVIRLRVSREGTLISDLSNEYTLSKLNASNIDVEVQYDGDDVYSYVVTWSAQNVSGGIDMASGYNIQIKSGTNIVKSIYVDTDSIADGSGYKLQYNDGIYTLTLYHDDISLDMTKNTTISMLSVVGSTVSQLNTGSIAYITNSTVKSASVSYLSKPNAMNIAGGKIALPNNKPSAAKAILAIYNSSNVLVGSKVELNSSDFANGYSPSGLEEGKVYYAVLQFIGNSASVVNSWTRLDNIMLTNTPSGVVGLNDGVVNITSQANTEYYYSIDNGSATKYNSSVNTNSLGAGSHTMTVFAIEDNKLVSGTISYNLCKLSTSFISVELQYDGDEISGYKVYWMANNKSGNVDLASGYKIVTTNGSNTTTYDIISNASVEEAGLYKVEYSAGAYTLTIYHTNAIDVNRSLDIQLKSVIGSTITPLTEGVIGYITSNSTNSYTITYLTAPGAMTIVGGKIILPNDKPSNASAVLSIYNSDDMLINSKSLTSSDFANGHTPQGLEEDEVYYAVLKYIGNNTNLVTSTETSVLNNIAMTSKPSVSVQNGSLVINNMQNISYYYGIDTDTLTEYDGLTNVIDTDSIGAGNHTIALSAIEDGKLSSVVNQYLFSKLREVSDLVASIDLNNHEEVLRIQFTPNNIVNTSDKVSKYLITISDKGSQNKLMLEKTPADMILHGGKYVVEVTNIDSQYFNAWGATNIVISVTEVGEDYISNTTPVMIERSRLSDNLFEIGYNAGDLEIEYVGNISDDFDAFELVFVGGGNTYVYHREAFNSGSVTIDFSTTKVNGNTIFLPGGEYQMYVRYLSDNDTVLNSISSQHSVKKAEDISQIQLMDSARAVWCGEDSIYVYNYNLNNVYMSGQEGTIDFTTKASGQYTLQVQRTLKDDSGLKSNFSKVYELYKLTPVGFDAILIKDDEYRIEITLTVPEINRGGGKDLASRYKIKVNDVEYTINSNKSTSSELIDVVYSNYTYTITLILEEQDIFSADGILLDNSEIGKILYGIEDISSMNISVEAIYGDSSVATSGTTVLSNTNELTACKIAYDKVNSITTSNISITESGLLDIDVTDIIGLYSLGLEFYLLDYSGNDIKYIKKAEYIVPFKSGVLDVMNTDDITGLVAGEYLIVAKAYGNSGEYIDANAFIINNITISEQSNLYIQHGELQWTKPNSAKSIVFELTNVDTGDIYTFTDEYMFKALSGKDYAVGSYNYTIRAIVSGGLKSATSRVFTAIKLPSPTVTMNRVDSVAVLKWQEVSGASGYDVYDYHSSFVNPTITTVADTSCAVNLSNVVLGQHRYYVISKGSANTTTTNLSNVTYASSGYINSYNDHNTSYDMATILNNTVDEIRYVDGMIEWDMVVYVDYYNIILTPYSYDAGSGSYVAGDKYQVHTTYTTFDIKGIANQSIRDAQYIDIEIENRSLTADYLIISTTLSNPLTKITIFNSLQDDIFSNFSISGGRLSYVIANEYINGLIALMNNVRQVSGHDIIKYSIKDIVNDQTFLYSYLTPVVTINGAEYRLGEGLFDDFSIIIDAETDCVSSFAEISSITDNDWQGCDKVYVIFDLPNDFANGYYKVTLKSLYNNNDKNVAVLSSYNTTQINRSVYRLPKPGIPQVGYDNLTIYNNRLVFNASTNDSGQIVTDYKLAFINADDPFDTRWASITVSEDNALMTLDATNNVVAVDVYSLFVDGGYIGFEPLNTNVNYYIRVEAMGGSIYFNSGYSTSSTPFKIFSAPTLNIENESITWGIEEGVVEYIIYFYDVDGNEISQAREVLSDISGKSKYEYTNVRNNHNLVSEIYSIKVQAVGNKATTFTSRLTDCDEFYGEKLDQVAVKVVDGQYVWDKVPYTLISNNGSVENTQYWGNYTVDVYVKGELLGSHQVEDLSHSTQVLYELPEEYTSMIEDVRAEYSIMVYSNTSRSACLLPNDTYLDVARIRSHSISGNATILANGDISWVDTNLDTNNYIVFVYSGDYLVFTSGVIKTNRMNIYNLYSVYDNNNIGSGNKFVPGADTYIIRIRSIDKIKYTDDTDGNVNNYDAILRSVYTGQIIVKTMAKPSVTVTDGDISWNNLTGHVGYELDNTRIQLSGKYRVGGTVVNIGLLIELDKTINQFIFQSIPVRFVNDSIYIYDATSSMMLDFIEGETYDVRIRYIANENVEVVFGATAQYLLSSEEISVEFNLLTNPVKATNPKIYAHYEEGTPEKAIYDNIPGDYRFTNYIYWAKPIGSIDNYNIEFYLGEKEILPGGESSVDANIKYTFKVRGQSVSLYDANGTIIEDVYNYDMCVSYYDDKGVYLALDRVLERIVLGDDYSIDKIVFIYLQSIGDNSLLLQEENNITHHLSKQDKLSNSLEISLPEVPSNLSYDGKGMVSWDRIDNDQLQYELVVAYQKGLSTTENLHYDNISRIVLNKDNQATYRDRIVNMLGITNADYANKFTFAETTEIYYIDTILLENSKLMTTNGGLTSYYKLRYLSSNIEYIVLRSMSSISNIGQDGEDLSYVSNPAVIASDIDGESMVFNLFANGDGSEENPFVISEFESISYYLDEACHFIISTDIDSTISLAPLGIAEDIVFNGVLDGNGKTIEYAPQLAEKSGKMYFGLFYMIDESASIVNLNVNVKILENTIDSTSVVWGGCVAVNNYGLIANVKVSGTIYAKYTAKDLQIAGIVYDNNGTIAYSTVEANITVNGGSADSGNSMIAGIASYSGNKNASAGIYYSAFTGEMSGNDMAGIVGKVYAGTIDSCYNTGSMTVTKKYSGDIKLSGLVHAIEQSGNVVNIKYSFVKIKNFIVANTVSNNVTYGGLIHSYNRNTGINTTGRISINSCNYSIDNLEINNGANITTNNWYGNSSNTGYVEKSDGTSYNPATAPNSIFNSESYWALVVTNIEEGYTIKIIRNID